MTCVFQIFPRQLQKSRVTHWGSQPARDWKTEWLYWPLPLSEGSKYALFCVVTVSRLTQTFLCHYANQAATTRGLEKLTTLIKKKKKISDQWSLFKGHDMQDWGKEHDIKWRSHLPYKPQAAVLLTVRPNWATSLSLFTFMHWRRKWQPTPVFLPGESQGRGNLVGCRLWGRTESDTTKAT